MKCNIGKTERIVRIVAALAFIALGAILWSGFYALGAVVFFTAIIAWCPISAVQGISICMETEQEEIPAETVSTKRTRCSGSAALNECGSPKAYTSSIKGRWSLALFKEPHR